MNKTVLLAKAQTLAILITAQQFSTYDYVGVVDRAEDLKGKVCLNGLDIIAKQESFVNKHGISKIMKDNKLFEKLVSYGQVINSGGVYQHNGKNYYLPLHIMRNRRRTLGCNIEITDAQNYIKLARNAGRVNKFLAEFGLPTSIVEVHGPGPDLLKVSAISGSIRESKYVNEKSDGYNRIIELSDKFRTRKPDKYKNIKKFNKNANSILIPNYVKKDGENTRFRFVVDDRSILIEKFVMGMIMGYTQEYPIVSWHFDGLKKIEANVMTGTGSALTAEKITGHRFPFIDFNSIEPLPDTLNKTHAKNIELVSTIINWGFIFYGLSVEHKGRAVVSFSGYDTVISALCDELKRTGDVDIAHKLFTYMVCCCNIHMVQ